MEDIKKSKKKNWYSIVAPTSFNNAFIGETSSSTIENMIGRPIAVNLSTITKDIKNQNTKISFKINEYKDNVAQTIILGFHLQPSYIRRMIRKGRKIIEDSFTANTKDNINLRIKTFIITKNETNNSIASEIRKKAKELIVKEIQEEDFESLFKKMCDHRLQSNLKKILNKVYPLVCCEIRDLHKI